MLSTGQTSFPQFGGTMLVDFGAAAIDKTFGPTVGGAATTTIPIPASPGIIGLTVYTQCGGGDATQTSGIAMSNGLAHLLGS